MVKPSVDYSVYLVTDSGLVPEGKTLQEQVQKAIEGGVTIVQLREKDAETKDFIEKALAIRDICHKAGVPLLINDRIDVALAIDADGVHIGQDDIDVATVRKILGPDKIVGLSVTYVSETTVVATEDIDYVGIGTIFETNTKKSKKAPIGINGIRKVLAYLSSLPRYVYTVAIGSVNTTNARNVVYLSQVPERRLDGVAVVSALICAEDPTSVAQELSKMVREPPYWMSVASPRNEKDILIQVPAVLQKIRQTTPLVHNIINRVATNFAANVDLAIGSSPIMTENTPEFSDLSLIPNSALLVNMGFATEDKLAMYFRAITAYKQNLKPVILDPVGAGASQLRRDAVKELLNRGQYDVIKGNEGEIFTVAGEISQMRGVDSNAFASLEKKIDVVEGLAAKEKTIVVLTGKEDIVSDGISTYILKNGHEYLGNITASGCVLGSIISAAVAVNKEDRLLSAIAALLLFTIAAERAAALPSVRGPGTFQPALLDELYLLTKSTEKNDISWLSSAKIEKYAPAK
ncbi:Hydroxyethylthiazole kinase family-domain-containing protein [Dipodascopsis uninucleata]